MSRNVTPHRPTRPGRRLQLAIALGASALAAGALSASAAADPTGGSTPGPLAPANASANYTFQNVDNPQDLTFNQLLGINDNETMAGYFGSGDPGHPNKGYVFGVPGSSGLTAGFGGHRPPGESGQSQSSRGHGQFDSWRSSRHRTARDKARDPQPSFLNENFPGSAQTQVVGLNNVGTTVGFWVDGAGDNFGFYTVHGQFHQADFPTPDGAKPSVDQLLGVNDRGDAVGFYTDAEGNNHGYQYDTTMHRYSRVQVPGDTNLTAAGVNDLGDIAGFADNAAGDTEGFLMLSTGRVVHLNVPGASSTQAFGVNNGDEVVGSYTVGSGDDAASHGFVWSPGLGFETVDDPNGIGTTTINGVNDRGAVVGFYTDAQGNTDGFVGLP